MSLTTINTNFSFQTGMYFENNLLCNLFEINVTMLVETASIREQNIALTRMRYFLTESLEHSIIIHENEIDMINKLTQCGIKVCTLPEQPYDQILGIMLMTKFNAITEGRLIITDMEIGSRLGDNVSFIQSIEDPIGPFEAPGWWNESNTKISSVAYSDKKEKIVRLMKNNSEWDSLELSWKEKPKRQVKSAEILFTNSEE